eukprot:TRINITY_DN12323_c0_g1_i1.p1 TRINITY_DN12323_c0_g1~~TRINITY_DN12323_c0_g1_i1.p1  ORF type:complete len:261 (+),score=13.91 TRINITY_DN12323_c0_g1_i1:57-839(+)
MRPFRRCCVPLGKRSSFKRVEHGACRHDRVASLGGRVWLRPFCIGARPSRDPHDVLGVQFGASAKEVRKAYLRQVQSTHPDKNPAPDARQRFQEIQEAYAALSDGSNHASRSTFNGASSADFRQPSHRGSEAWRDPMGSGMHYEEFYKFHAERARRANETNGWAPPNTASQGSTTRDILFSQRGWVYGGLVHRSLDRFSRALMRLWPAWLFLLALLLSRRGQFGADPAASIYYDNFGRAWYLDIRGQERRAPRYDRLQTS